MKKVMEATRDVGGDSKMVPKTPEKIVLALKVAGAASRKIGESSKNLSRRRNRNIRQSLLYRSVHNMLDDDDDDDRDNMHRDVSLETRETLDRKAKIKSMLTKKTNETGKCRAEIGSGSKSASRPEKCNIRRSLLFLSAHDMLDADDDQYATRTDVSMRTRELLQRKVKTKAALLMKTRDQTLARRVKTKALLLKKKTRESPKRRRAQIDKVVNGDETTFKKQVDVFRTNSTKFICRMNLVQGDRHFVRWQGSVLDSVVGTYMSQNCTDQTSSIAFMELAAEFPNDVNLPVCESEARGKFTGRWNSYGNPKIKDLKAVRDEFAHLHEKYGNSQERRNPMTNCINWEAVRVAEHHEVSDVIVRRGMHIKLSARIQDFLNGLFRDIGTLDLEWLKNVPIEDFDKVKTYLMSVEGLGYKSIECVRLLSLAQRAFPVDINVARVVIRFGWVRLQSSVPLHRVKRYPPPNEIYKYLEPLVAQLDHKTLYELHYHMITFGKVFCKEIKPRCGLCPMRDECCYFASKKTRSVKEIKKAEVHEPAVDIEDLYKPSSSDDILLTSLIDASPATIEKMQHCVQRKVQERRESYQPGSDDDDVPLISFMPPSFTPRRKPKHISPWRTEHQVYELPDSHPLLATRDTRDIDDHCQYLLAVWKQDHESVKTNEDSVKVTTYPVTLLIPCRTALRGRFPLNGTHFQPNEFFADSTPGTIEVSVEMLANLKKRTLYCGPSLSTVATGMNETSMRRLFCEAFLCTRGFNTVTRRPTPLPDMLHKQFKKSVRSVKLDST